MVGDQKEVRGRPPTRLEAAGLETGLAGEFPFNKAIGKFGQKATYGPNADIVFDQDLTIDIAEYNEIARKEKVIYFWGRIEYRDAFENDRWLEFKCVSSTREFNHPTWKLVPVEGGHKSN